MFHHIKILSAIFLSCLCSYGFNLYHLSDLHFSDWNDTNSLNIVKAVNNDPSTDVVVVSGDLVEAGSTYEYDFFNRYSIDFEHPNTFFTAGNHETVLSGTGGKYLFNHFLDQELHWYHDIDTWRIIGLNTAVNFIHYGYVDDTEMAWLENVLKEANDAGKNSIVASHFFPTGSFGYNTIINEHELFTLLKKYDVKLFLCGHQHKNQMWRTNGVPVIPVGAGKYSYHSKYAISGNEVILTHYKDTVDSITQTIYNSNGEFQPAVEEFTTVDSSDTQSKVLSGTATIKKLYKAPGIIYGSVVLDNGLISFGCSDGKVYSINADNGELIDTVELSGEASMSPVYYNGELISISDQGEISCSDWKTIINDGISSQPAILGDRLIVGTALGNLKSIDLTTGNEAKSIVPAEKYPVSPVTVKGDKFYAADDMGYIFAYDNELNLSWKTNTSPYPEWLDMFLAMSPTKPVIAGDKVAYVRRDLDSSEKIVLTGEVHAYSISTGSEAWIYKFDLATPGIGAMASYDSSILFCDGKFRLVALDPDDGSEEWNIPIGFEVSRMTVSGDFAVVCALKGGEMDVVDLKEKKVITRMFLCNEYILSEPVIDGFTIYQTTFEGHVFKCVFDTTVDIQQGIDHTLFKTGIKQNYPNPFNRVTTIEYMAPGSEQITLEILNIHAQKIKTLFNGRQYEGDQKVMWDGKDDRGNALAAGIYYCRLKTAKHNYVRKIILVR